MPRSRAREKDDGHYGLSFFLNEARKHKVMTREEERELARKVRAGGPEGEHARNEFVRRNMRLVVAIARRYSCEDMPLPDLVQEGCIGILNALNKYDPERGFKFATYASWWIRQAIVRARHGSGLIRLPSYVVLARAQLRHLEQSLGGLPPAEDLPEKTGFSPALLQLLKELPVAVNVLDSPVGGEDGDTLWVDGVADPSDRVAPDHELELAHLHALVDQALQDVPERNRELFLLWAMGGYTLETLSQRTGLTRERVRQIVQRLLYRLRRDLQ
jgi:RNA polymerase sigma factor (sigma-70 family)